jgi:hypothetical protein
VRSSLKPLRSRCTHCMLCCSTLLTGTKRMLLAPQRPVRRHAAGALHRVHLDLALGQVDAYPNQCVSDNLAHETSPFHSCRLRTHSSNLGPSTPLLEGGKSLQENAANQIGH